MVNMLATSFEEYNNVAGDPSVPENLNWDALSSERGELGPSDFIDNDVLAVIKGLQKKLPNVDS